MKGKTMNFSSSILLPSVLVLACVGIVYATLAGKHLPLISTPRAALIALLVVGMAACMGGIGQVGVSGRWLSPLAILGYGLGAAILVVFISALAGWKVPFIDGETQSVVAMGIMIIVKFLIGTAGFLLHLL